MLGAKRTTARFDNAVSLRRLSDRYQVVSAIADQITTPHSFECLAQQRPVVGVVIAKKCFVQAPLGKFFDGAQGVAIALDPLQRIAPRVVHRRGGCHGGGIEGLHLISAEAMLLEP